MLSMSPLIRWLRTRAPRAQLVGTVAGGLLALSMLLIPSAALGADHRPESQPASIPDLSPLSVQEGGSHQVQLDDDHPGDEHEADENEGDEVEGDEVEGDEDEADENEADENEGDEDTRDQSGGGLDEESCRDFDDGEDRCLDATALPAIETSPVSAPAAAPDLTAPAVAIGLGGVIAAAMALARRRRAN